jgi:hypothetical protein
MADIGTPSHIPGTSGTQEAAQNAAMPSDFYAAAGNFAAKTVSVAADRYKLLTPADGSIKIAGVTYYWPTQQTLDLSQTATWDTIAGTDYRTASERAGKDFYVYACAPAAGITTPIFKVSINASAPAGYTTADSRLVGGFHGLCVAVSKSTLTGWAADTVIAVGETRKATAVPDDFWYRCTVKAGDFKTHATDEPVWSGIAVGATIVDDQITWIKEQHSLEGYVAGDILPASVWDLKRFPLGFAVGMVRISSSNHWVAIYGASGTGVNTVSAYGGTISHSRTYQNFIADLYSINQQPLTPTDRVMASLGSNQNTIIAGGADPPTSGGHSDAYGRRMISHLGCEDMIGAHSEFLAMSTSTTIQLAEVSYLNTGDSFSFTYSALTGQAWVGIRGVVANGSLG